MTNKPSLSVTPEMDDAYDETPILYTIENALISVVGEREESGPISFAILQAIRPYLRQHSQKDSGGDGWIDAKELPKDSKPVYARRTVR